MFLHILNCIKIPSAVISRNTFKSAFCYIIAYATVFRVASLKFTKKAKNLIYIKLFPPFSLFRSFPILWGRIQDSRFIGEFHGTLFCVLQAFFR